MICLVATVEEGGLNPGRGERGIFEAVKSTIVARVIFPGPSGVRKGVPGEVPIGAEVEILIIEIPRISIVHEGDSNAEVDFWIGKRLLCAQGSRESRSRWCGCPDSVVVDRETVVCKKEAVAGAVGRHGPWIAVFIPEAAADGAVLISKGDTFPSVAELTAPGAKDPDRIGHTVSGPEG